MNQPDIGIVGGGIIGMSIGWQLVRSGAKVTVYERNEVGRQTTWVSAGMLAPYAEVNFEEVDLMELGEASLQRYPAFLEQLEEDADQVPTFDRCGTLLAGVDRDDMEILRRLYQFRDRLDLRVEMRSGSEAREFEPLLAPHASSGVWLPDDAQIDQRSLVDALKAAFLRRNGTLYEHLEVQTVNVQRGAVRGVKTCEGEWIDHDAVCLAAGSWTNQIDGIPDEAHIPLRPVKGQILSVWPNDECNLRFMIRTPRVYLVPKEEGPIVIGATSEEQGFDTEPTAGGIMDLLDEAWDIVPSIYDLPLKTTTAGIRPATRDNAPVIGESTVENLYYATGHYRSGILYTPITAFGIVSEIMNGDVLDILKPYRPDRFSKSAEKNHP